MGIYLPNIEKMPRKGEMLVVFPDGTSYVCFNGMRERLAQTTAIPVSPHGRLIDADALHEELCALEYVRENEWLDGVREARGVDAARVALLDAPTIIPAEEGE